jgi:hypothetical protein
VLTIGCTCGCSTHVWPCPCAITYTPPAAIGWICPVCKGGVSPHAAKCPCTLITYPRYVETGFPGVTWPLPPSTTEPCPTVTTSSIAVNGPTVLALN